MLELGRDEEPRRHDLWNRSGCSRHVRCVFKTRNRSVGIHEYWGGIIFTCLTLSLSGVRVGIEAESLAED